MRARSPQFLATLLVALLCATGARATLALQPGDKISAFGDSITAGVGQGPWYNATYLPTVNAAYVRAVTVLSTSLASATTKIASASTSPSLAAADYRPTVLNAGVSGDTVAMMLARVNADVISHAPTVIIIECCVNDAKNGTSLGTFATTVSSLISTIQSALPTARIMWIGAFCFGETYPAAGTDTLVPSYNAVIVAACASSGITYVDVRTPQQAYEAAHNAPPGSVDTGIACFDATPPGVHPSAAVGQVIFGTAALSQTSLTGTPQ